MPWSKSSVANAGFVSHGGVHLLASAILDNVLQFVLRGFFGNYVTELSKVIMLLQLISRT